jgi:hypothetical protein
MTKGLVAKVVETKREALDSILVLSKKKKKKKKTKDNWSSYINWRQNIL